MAIIATLIVSACSSAAAPNPASPGSPDDHTYLSTDLQGAALVPGTRIRLAFADGRLNANGGCNTMSGPYLIADGRLTATQLSMTEMGCDEPRMQQDEWLARLLADVTLTLDGDTLTLTDGATRLTLTEGEAATLGLPLEGTRWALDGIVSADAVSSVPDRASASIQIVAGRIDVDAGCNAGGGPVTVTADTLTFGPITLTKRLCEPQAMAAESAVVAVLAGTATYTISADVLTLDAGDAGLVFRAAP